MTKYYVNIREVHISSRLVEANSEKEALDHIVNGITDGEEILCEYSHTLHPDTWTVDKEECEYCGKADCEYDCDESQAGGFNNE